MTVLQRRPGALVAVLLAALSLIAWFAYAPAFSGTFALDDTANLGGLASINDTLSALRFVFAGEAGPLGRPIALASFLPQADAWQDGARSFLQVNVALHIVNGLLVAWLLLMLASTTGLPAGDGRFAALAATATWLFMPLLASSSLMIVQRMTTLSATFVLAGIIAWLIARRRYAHSPWQGMAGMFSALSLATLLAILTKENGALLPVYLLVLEVTLLSKPPNAAKRNWKTLQVLLLGLPTAALLVYLATRLPYADTTVLRREFDGWERLLTQAGVLWEYLFKAFLPLPGSIGPVNDVQPVARSIANPFTLLAVVVWLGLAGFAFVKRRRYPLAAFAILWFLGGHLLESTTLSLELYFDHRNYLPIIGPVFAAGAGLLAITGRPILVRLLLPVYVLMQCGMLVLLTTLWGEPLQSARYWYQKYPDSVRAATTLVTRQLQHESVAAGLQTLQQFVRRKPQHSYLLIQDINIACQLDPAADHSAQVGALSGMLADDAFTYTAGTMLSELTNTAVRTGCKGAEPSELRQLMQALHANPRYRDDPAYSSLHHELLALSYRVDNDFAHALVELKQAQDIGVDRDIVTRRIITLAEAGRFAEARQLVAAARDDDYWHPARRWLRKRDLDDLEAYIAAIEQAPDGGNGGEVNQ